jgi:hypothetical protein
LAWQRANPEQPLPMILLCFFNDNKFFDITYQFNLEELNYWEEQILNTAQQMLNGEFLYKLPKSAECGATCYLFTWCKNNG